MMCGRNSLCFAAVIFLQWTYVTSVVVPTSSCYALDNTSHLVDFTHWIGRPFEYNGKDADVVIRFCKDVEHRSQAGYVDFGHYETLNYFMAGSGSADFVQGYYGGDLEKCEHSFDKMGRTAQVGITCGSCLNGACKGQPGCICSVTYDQSMCRVFVELAISCSERGSRVFEGFTIGFNPRSWELVYNGMTQPGYEKLHHEFSFGTEQTHVSLYLTAISSLSRLVKEPFFKVKPDKGLEVKLTGSAVSGRAPTTLSPTILNVYWRCEVARETPYEVKIVIPVDGYDPIRITLAKLCDYKQAAAGEVTNGWATFGVISCIFIVASTIICCGGFFYKTRIGRQHGLDALPGMTILSALLETVSGPRGFPPGDDDNLNFAHQASWERPSVSSQGIHQRTDKKYGSI